MTTSLTIVGQQVNLELQTYFANQSDSLRTYFTERRLEDAETILVMVVPGTVKSSLLSHRGKRREIVTIDVCLRKIIPHHNGDQTLITADVDAMMEIIENIGDHFEFRRLSTPGITTICNSVQLRYPYIIEDLEEWSQYTGIATLNCLVLR